MDPRLLTPHQATAPEYLNMCLDQVYRLVREGELKHIKVGRKILIPVKAIEVFTERAFDQNTSTIARRPKRPVEGTTLELNPR